MKISVNWMLDHIATPVTTIDVGLIAAKFNIHTAEIEHYEKINLDIAHLFLVRIDTINQDGCFAWCYELQKNIELSFRNDVQVGQFLLVRRCENSFAWETLKQYGSSKDGLFPAVDCHEDMRAGAWKQECEDRDFILDVDNKSINHRPDLWGHRGIAREVAAFMGWQLKPLEKMVSHISESHYELTADKNTDHSLALEAEDLAVCPRVAALYCNQITHKPSTIWMAMRLARVDSKPINTIVDITNYVMFDISQPMHVFDGAHIPDKKISIRRGQLSEKLELLDGTMVSLTDHDIVVTDGKNPIGCAGVMGGKHSGFSPAAQSIILESGSFHASMVRNTAARIKVATEAVTRFSKQLDPMQNTTAILRFVHIAQGLGVMGAVTENIVSVGKIIEPAVISISHASIESRLGIVIASEQIVSLLQSLEFSVKMEQARDRIYHVTIPTFRMTKDITIAEDVLEEVLRLYGFNNIAYKSPVRAMQSFDMSDVMNLRRIKEYCAFGMKMREIREYPFYDESFVKRLGWYPKDFVNIKNPVSENWKVLVTSLIPHLIKNVELNVHSHEHMNFFEHNSIWNNGKEGAIIESKSLAGIFFGSKTMNFYDYKSELEGMLTAFNYSVVWTKATDSIEPWFDAQQTADIMLEGVKIGRAGMLSLPFVRSVIKGQGFVFEINAELLLSYKHAPKKFIAWSKYQAVSVDVSMLIDVSTKSESLERLILQTDSKIDRVSLIDFFEKEEWAGKRSLTFRYRISDHQQNLTKDVIEEITNKVISSLLYVGAQIR